MPQPRTETFNASRPISAVVPAFNEARTIEWVILDLLAIPFITEVVVVNDGSRDRTAEVLEKYKDRIVVISLPRNRGKGHALAVGIEAAKGDIVLTLDGDVVPYTERDLRGLARPLLEDEADFTLKPTPGALLKSLTGIRCYWRKDLLPITEPMKKTTRYGVEIFLNRKMHSKRKAYVLMHDYRHFRKFDKFPLYRALWEYAKEGASLIRQFARRNGLDV